MSRLKLGTKLIVLMVSISSISIIAVSFFGYRVGTNVIDEQINQLLKTQTERALESINMLIFNRLNDIQLMIADSTLKNEQSTPEEKAKVMKNKLTTIGWFEQFHLTDPSGVVKASTLNKALNQNISESDWFNAGKKDFIHVSDVVVSPFSGKESLIFLNTLQSQDNTILGYIIAEFSLNVIEDLLKNTPENIETYIISNEGKVIVSYPKKNNNASIGENGHYLKSDEYLQQEIKSEGYFSFNGNGWILAAQIPKEIAYQPIDRFSFFMIIFAVGVGLVIIGLGQFSTKRVVKPILSLTHAVTEVRKGNLKQQIPVESDDEIGYLAKSFNSMTKEIDQKTTNLIEEKGKYKSILESTDEAIALFDIENKGLAFNEKFQIILNKTGKKVPQKTAQNILNFITKNNVDQNSYKTVDLIQKLIKDKDLKRLISTELTILKPFYGIFRLYSKPVQGEDGRLLGRIWVFNDVTQEMESERSKNQFIHIASHKLRTPLTTVNWNAQMLLDGTFGDLTGDQKETIKQIKFASRNLNSLSNILINVAEIKKDKVPISKENFDLSKMLEEVLVEAKEKNSEDKQVKLINKIDLPKETKAHGDPKKLKEVFRIILDNAARYKKDKGTNVIELSVSTEKNHAFIKISDKGIGISNDDKPKIFSQFFRSKEAELIYPDGSGLSLFLAKIILLSSKEKFWFESQEGEGTTFYFTISLARD